MHGKEKVIAPVLHKEFGVVLANVAGLNTDAFGRFSGEVQRENNALVTVKNKALAALEIGDASLVIASEGSFGPHPSSHFIAANEELLILIDTQNDLEIVGRYFTTNTNFSSRKIENQQDLEAFKSAVGFPEHGIIVKTTAENKSCTIYKELDTDQKLYSIVQNALLNHHTIMVESDMRAMRNPTRMLAIEQAVLNLVKNIKATCDRCGAPGFVVRNAIAGLPCELCRTPTKAAKAYLYHCHKCAHVVEVVNESRRFEDAQYCDYCNP